MFYERIFRELNKRKIKYLVVGGVAVNLYGFSRATGDLDLLISLDESNLKKFIKMIKYLGFVPMIPVRVEEFADQKKREKWIKEKDMKVFSVHNPKGLFERIDVLIGKRDFDKAYKKKRIFNAGGLRIPVISIDDLIKMKKKAARERDVIDLGALKEIKELMNEKSERR